MDQFDRETWIPIASWAESQGIKVAWARILAIRRAIRLGSAIAAQSIAGRWVVRRGATYIKRPPGPPKGFTDFKRARIPPDWTLPYCDQGDKS